MAMNKTTTVEELESATGVNLARLEGGPECVGVDVEVLTEPEEVPRGWVA